jgi:hypothetical protein
MLSLAVYEKTTAENHAKHMVKSLVDKKRMSH